MASPEKDQFLKDVKPIAMAVMSFLVWLRRPDWSVPSCVSKAEDFWKLTRD